MTRLLITTSDELTWRFDQPVLFLGEWCRRYDRRHVWEKLDASVASPYGLGQEKKDIDYAEARILEAKIFPIFCSLLNKCHSVQYSERFWRIVLGHWFRRYIDTMFNRVKTIEHCLREYQISKTVVYAHGSYSLATQDSSAAIWAFSDDRWNSALYGRILELLDPIGCSIEEISESKLTGFGFDCLSGCPAPKMSARKWAYHKLTTLLGWLSRDKDAFIIGTYLPKQVDLKLQLVLGQIPQLHTAQKIANAGKPLQDLRKKLAENLLVNPVSSLEKILSLMLFELLPICYLEGLPRLKELADRQPWPKKPKFIFTSNNFDTDEVFKFWAATKIESGSKYYVGQHGNGYGTWRYMSPTIEEITADSFLTWGWTDGLPQHVPAFIFKASGIKALRSSKEGGLLLIETCLGHRITTWDSTYEFCQYYEEQKIFVSKLENEPRKNLIIRLSPASDDLGWNEKSRWKTFDAELNIDIGKMPIMDLIAKSRLVVHSYDSTGILETLSQNIPTLAFWQNSLEHLSDSAKPYYQMLINAGIIHLDPESIAKKVNEIWGDIDAWWMRDDVKNARQQFCNHYARQVKDPIKILSKYLL
ncbi:transferase [Polynucleobacter paneuropaeus]|jgi:putative transferase (TIGR04331 family)|uniref:LIC12162 family transferase n=1 Tax=Polynucleobacter paneuropaeus TaxID=2527775 RepID=UPI001BFE7AB6|nr:LIC12162 family protein [Polynucleobacter paneuropaeus]MBT8633203.1 transferase [Polynucleobacter paneuropaeus]